MFSIRRRGLCATAALATGTVLAATMLAGGGLAASASVASASTSPAPQPGHGNQHDKNKAGIRLVKSASPRFYSAPGQMISYTYWVTNTGQVPLYRITLTDNRLGRIACPKSTLGSYKWMTCTGTYTTTWADVKAGHIDNSATVTGRPRKGHKVSGTATAVVTAVKHPRHPAIGLAKWAYPTTYGWAGQKITYAYRVTNTGDVTLHDIMLADNKIPGPIACPTSKLAPGKWMDCHAVHVTTKAEVRAGHICNVATTAGRPPRGSQVKAKAEACVVLSHHTLPVVPVTG